MINWWCTDINNKKALNRIQNSLKNKEISEEVNCIKHIRFF
jgi:hypothetical protein